MQAGLYSITLTENKQGGEVIVLDKSLKLNIVPSIRGFEFSLSAQIDDLQAIEIEQINNSIVGWLASFNFNDLTTKTVNNPFLNIQNTAINTNVSHSRNINLKTWSKQGLIASV